MAIELIAPARAQRTFKDLLSTKEAAIYLNLHPSTLEKWRIYGGGPKAYRLGAKAIRYRRADLDAFVDGGERV